MFSTKIWTVCWNRPGNRTVLSQYFKFSKHWVSLSDNLPGSFKFPTIYKPVAVLALLIEVSRALRVIYSYMHNYTLMYALALMDSHGFWVGKWELFSVTLVPLLR